MLQSGRPLHAYLAVIAEVRLGVADGRRQHFCELSELKDGEGAELIEAVARDVVDPA
mgnify:CR=1 FL=1